MYLLKQLKRAGIDEDSLVEFYCACISSVLEYGCQVFHCSLPEYLSNNIERLQRRALRIIYSDPDLKDTLRDAKLNTLKTRRNNLSLKLFKSIGEDKIHKLLDLRPQENIPTHNFKTLRKYKLPTVITNRFKGIIGMPMKILLLPALRVYH